MDDSIIAKRGPYEHHEETGHKLVGYAAVHGVFAAARKCQNCTLHGTQVSCSFGSS